MRKGNNEGGIGGDTKLAGGEGAGEENDEVKMDKGADECCRVQNAQVSK